MADSFTFNDSNPRAQAAAISQGSEFVVSVGAETKQAINLAISEAIGAGIPPEQSARLIRDMVGLTSPQVAAVANFRQNLIDGGLSSDRVANATARYQAKLLRDRARTISRTETIDALESGKLEAWTQAEDEGLLIGAVKRWIASDPCPICQALHGQRVRIKENFSGGGVTVAGPTAHPNCECSVAVERDQELRRKMRAA